jgi:hypothetical protein
VFAFEIVFKQDVLGLEVGVCDADLVEGMDGLQELSKDFT